MPTLHRPSTKVGIFIFACYSYLCRQSSFQNILWFHCLPCVMFLLRFIEIHLQTEQIKAPHVCGFPQHVGLIILNNYLLANTLSEHSIFWGVRRFTGVLRSVVYHVYRLIVGQFQLTAILHHYAFRSLCAQLLILPRNYSSCNIISFILKIFTFFPAFEYL